MKRLFGKSFRPQPPVADIPADVPSAETEKPSLPTPTPAKPSDDALDFELREPTPEELSASILSRQDFVDLDRIFSDDPLTKKVFKPAKAPLLAPGVAPKPAEPVIPALAASPSESKTAEPKPPEPAVPVQPAPPTQTAPTQQATAEPASKATADPAPVETTPVVKAEAAVEPKPVVEPTPAAEAKPVADAKPAAPPKAPPLIGYLEGFFLGRLLGGWVGDPNDPGCRTIKVTAFVDGKEVASAIADRPRKDIPYGEYHIPFPDLEVWKYVLENRLEVRASRDGGEFIILTQLDGVRKRANAARAQAIGTSAETQTDAPVAPTPRTAKDLSPIRIPVGMESRNGATILGRDGFLFGYRDANNILAQYNIAPEHEQIVQRDAAQWFLVFRARQAALADLGAVYVQTIMPEKATIMDDLAPSGLGPITARLAVIEAMIEKEALNEASPPTDHYRSLVAALRSCHAAGIPPYLRTASGLRTAGAQLVFYQLVQKMSALLPDRADAFTTIGELCGHLVPGKESEPFVGDLGRHFDLPIYESEQLPDLVKLAAYIGGDPYLVEGGDNPTKLAWRNPAAPSPLKVMAFGAPSYGRGVTPADLSWWSKSMFAEFCLVPSIEFVPAQVEQHRPDIVIAMTPERLLPRLPRR